MTSDTTLLTAVTSAGQLRLHANGSWTARHAAQIDDLVNTLIPATAGIDSVSIDMTAVNELDTFGAALLNSLVRQVRARKPDAGVTGLPQQFSDLYEAVQRVGQDTPSAAVKRHKVEELLTSTGMAAAGAWQDFTVLLNMLGANALAIARAARQPLSYRLTATVHHLDRVGWQAVPIIALITFLIGCIIAQQGFFHFRKFGADEYVVDMVGVLIMREIGVLIVAIMVAGRSGSAYTAELGSMKMREEIDALRTMGFDPVDVLILPRVIALVIALPILTFIGSMAALYGGGLVAWLYGGMSPDIFVARLREAVTITHFKVGMIKAPFMALVVGIVACSEGLKVAGSAASLGLHTTASVVKSIFLVIVLDGLFAIFFASIGM